MPAELLSKVLLKTHRVAKPVILDAPSFVACRVAVEGTAVDPQGAAVEDAAADAHCGVAFEGTVVDRQGAVIVDAAAAPEVVGGVCGVAVEGSAIDRQGASIRDGPAIPTGARGTHCECEAGNTRGGSDCDLQNPADRIPADCQLIRAGADDAHITGDHGQLAAAQGDGAGEPRGEGDGRAPPNSSA